MAVAPQEGIDGDLAFLRPEQIRDHVGRDGVHAAGDGIGLFAREHVRRDQRAKQ